MTAGFHAARPGPGYACHQIQDQESRRTEHPFGQLPIHVQNPHVEKQVNHAEMQKDGGRKPPPFAIERHRAEIRSPPNVHASVRFHYPGTGNRHRHEHGHVDGDQGNGNGRSWRKLFESLDELLDLGFAGRTRGHNSRDRFLAIAYDGSGCWIPLLAPLNRSLEFQKVVGKFLPVDRDQRLAQLEVRVFVVVDVAVGHGLIPRREYAVG